MRERGILKLQIRSKLRVNPKGTYSRMYYLGRYLHIYIPRYLGTYVQIEYIELLATS